MGKASIHPKKVQMKVRRYLKILYLDMCVKSLCQSSPKMCVPEIGGLEKEKISVPEERSGHKDHSCG